MLLTPQQRIVLAVARRPLLRARPRIWWNYARYRLAIARRRTHGPDALPYTPPEVFLWATARCNRRCDFCQFRGGLNQPGEPDLSLERFECFLQHRLVRGALRIGLYGGEPLLNPDLFRMVRAGQRRGHAMTIITNGTLLADRQKELLANKPDLLTVSYYPENRELLQAPVAAIAAAVPTKLHYVYSTTRMEGIAEAAAFAVRHGIMALALENVYPTGLTAEQPVADSTPALQELRHDIQRRYGKSLFISWLQSRSQAAIQAGAPTVCRVFWTRLTVDPSGRYSPCCVWNRSSYAGSLLDDADAWNSPAFTHARCAMRLNNPPARCQGCDWRYDEPISI